MKEQANQPEALKGNLSGWWSRRINDKNRLVYRIQDNVIEISQCRGHYDDK
ncbi:MAG: Txe/YoeB family addiction module toxin [Dysgonamonadaceae bacterium]|nr:Txe/YoeB family addiction module toxin [Dysgonamonadaceae bacterium]